MKSETQTAKAIRLFAFFRIPIASRMAHATSPLHAQQIWKDCLREAKAQYRRLAQQWHPDRAPGHEEQFKALVSAWEALQRVEFYPHHALGISVIVQRAQLCGSLIAST